MFLMKKYYNVFLFLIIMGNVAADPTISIGNVSVGGYEKEIIVPINLSNPEN